VSLLELAALALAWPLTVGATHVVDPQHGLIEFAWRGCRAERAGPVCVVEPGDEVVLWLRSAGTAMNCGPHNRPALTGRGTTQTASGADDGGCWTTVRIDDPHGFLALRGSSGELWRLPFAPRPPPDPDITRASRSLDTGDFAGAGRILEQAIARLRIDGPRLDLAEGLALARKLAFRAGRFDDGLALAGEARSIYHALGWTSSVCDLVFALVHHHWFDRHDAAATQDAMRAGARCAAELPRYAIHYRFNYAEIGADDRDAFATWRAYHGVDALARRLRDFDFEAAILSSQHVLADRLRRTDEVARIETRLDELWIALEGRRSCGMALARANVGWSTLMRLERGEQAPDPRPQLRDTLAVFGGDTRCRNLRSRDHAVINLALAELLHGEPRHAATLLIPLPDDRLAPEQSLWRHIVLARAGLATANLKLADTHARKLATLARRHADPTFAWHAAILEGHVLTALNLPEPAAAAYRAAEALREEMALPFALGASRERAAAQWDLGARRIVELQLANGDVAEALHTARSARRRSLRAIEALSTLSTTQRQQLLDRVVAVRTEIDEDIAHDDHRTGRQLERAFTRRREQRARLRHLFDEVLADVPLPTAPLRAPAEGELLLMFYPLTDRWVEFAAEASGDISAVFFDPTGLTDEALGEALLAPLTAAIARARMIRLIVPGALLARDLHGLPHRGRPLLGHVPVAYSLDLTDTRPAADAPLRGLVVASDPGGDVPHLRFAEEERLTVVAAWTRLGVHGISLAGDAAGSTDVLHALAVADILHFIGHHSRRPEAGRSTDAWDHALGLAHGTDLGVEDIMALPEAEVPRVVVLSACQTGLGDPETASGGVAVGHAFLLRGADLVIATSRLIDDAEGARVVAALYQHAGDPASLTQPATLAAAQQAVLSDETCRERPDVCAYRAFVP